MSLLPKPLWWSCTKPSVLWLPWQWHNHCCFLDQPSLPTDLLEAVEGDGCHSPHVSPAAQAAHEDG